MEEKSDDKKIRLRYTNSYIVLPITLIIKETTVLNSFFGLEEYNADNIQKKVEENTKLFIPLLDKYIPNWSTVYTVPFGREHDHKFRCLYKPIRLDRLQYSKEEYLARKKYLLTLLMFNIMSPARRLTKELCETEYGQENGVENTREDMMEIMLELGIPAMLFARYCSSVSFNCFVDT